jgi:hypothetical protein
MWFCLLQVVYLSEDKMPVELGRDCKIEFLRLLDIVGTVLGGLATLVGFAAFLFPVAWSVVAG